VRVKGDRGQHAQLEVNGVEVPVARVGKRATLQDKQLQAWEYIGVELKAGENTLTVSQLDQFGNARGSETVRVVAPDKLGRIAIEIPSGGGIADGRTPVTVTIRLTDERGTPVTVATPVTLDATLGRWSTRDLNPAEPGLQVMVEMAAWAIELGASDEPAPQVTARSGPFSSGGRLDFPRSSAASSQAAGRKDRQPAHEPRCGRQRANPRLEQESHLSREWSDAGRSRAPPSTSAGAIKGEAPHRGLRFRTSRAPLPRHPARLTRSAATPRARPTRSRPARRPCASTTSARNFEGHFTRPVAPKAFNLFAFVTACPALRERRVMVDAFASRDWTRQVSTRSAQRHFRPRDGR
jgi:hypothetical protein